MLTLGVHPYMATVGVVPVVHVARVVEPGVSPVIVVVAMQVKAYFRCNNPFLFL